MRGQIITRPKYRYIDTGCKLLKFDPATSDLIEVKQAEIVDGCPIIKCVQPPVSSLILHITKRCNLHCKHCYINACENTHELNLTQIYSILEQSANMGILGVAISGGESTIREDIQLIVAKSYRLGIYTDLLTNGTLLDKEMIFKIRPFVQRITLSLDGMQADHDWIRGNGNFKIIEQKLQMLKEASIPIAISTLINYRNINSLGRIKVAPTRTSCPKGIV